MFRHLTETIQLSTNIAGWKMDHIRRYIAILLLKMTIFSHGHVSLSACKLESYLQQKHGILVYFQPSIWGCILPGQVVVLVDWVFTVRFQQLHWGPLTVDPPISAAPSQATPRDIQASFPWFWKKTKEMIFWKLINLIWKQHVIRLNHKIWS